MQWTRYKACVNSKQTKTLRLLFETPIAVSIEWATIESLLVAVGCEVIEGSGSRVRFACKGVVASFHRPHPAREAKRYQVRDARLFLEKIGVRP